MIPDLSKFVTNTLSDKLLHIRQTLARGHGHLAEEFALLFVDGLSAREDELASALAAATGAMPLIGGSAGDGIHFRETLVFDGERILANAAVISIVRGDCPLRPFKMDHIKPTERRMVVTEADPAARIVRCINGEPAVREYARLIGMEPESVNTLTFAIHPLTVRMGDRHHVRAIQRVLPSGELLFFSAIDEGMVLSIAEPNDLVGHLSTELQALKAPANPVAVLAFDCILRRVEARERQMTGRVSELLRQHGVIGFSTYGEQIGPMHVNHTMTGFAFYPWHGRFGNCFMNSRISDSLLDPADSDSRNLEKMLVIADALMRHVEQNTGDRSNAFEQFRRAAMLEERVRQRTHDLEATLKLLNEANSATERARRDLSQALEAIEEGFALFDPTEVLVLCNSRFCRILPTYVRSSCRESLSPSISRPRVVRRFSLFLGVRRRNPGQLSACACIGRGTSSMSGSAVTAGFRSVNNAPPMAAPSSSKPILRI